MIAADGLAAVRASLHAWGELPEDLLSAQVREVSRAYPLSFVVTLFVTISLVLPLRAAPNFATIAIAAALHLVIAFVMLGSYFSARRAAWRISDPRRALADSVWEAAMAGGGWFVFLSTAGAEAGPENLVLVTTVMAGVIAAGALRYAAVPAAGLAFLGTSAAISVAHAAFNAIPASIYVCLAVFTLLLARVVSDMRSRFSAVEALGTALERALGQQGDLIGSARSHAREASSRTGELQLGVARAEEDSHRTSNLAGELGAAATALVERAERLQLASARFVAQLETA